VAKGPPRVWPSLALSALGATHLACGFGEPEAAEEPPALVVEATRVEPRSFSERLEIVGQIAAAESVVIQPEIAGVIQSVEFEEGQRASQGDVLFVLRSEEQRAALRAAQAERLVAQDVFDRTEALSKVQVSAAAELTAARARVEGAAAQVDMARVNLARTRIRAPFDGALGARYVSPGARVDSDTELVWLDATDRLKLEFSLPESAISLAEPGLAVSALVAAYPGEGFPGEVYFVSPALDESTRRLDLKAWIPNPDGRLRPGMFARVELEVERIEQALLVPESAIAYDLAGAFVWRVSGESRAERVSVRLGPRQNGYVVVESGIAVGDTVVTSGTHKVSAEAALDVRAPQIRADTTAGDS
jgi:membrane fusion protein (multidrug efflux system)